MESAKSSGDVRSFVTLVDECAKKNWEIEKKTFRNKELQEEKVLLGQLDKDFHAAIEVMEYYEPTIELRFYELEIEKIQEIKKHPIILEVGKTDLSPSSIRVVIA